MEEYDFSKYLKEVTSEYTGEYNEIIKHTASVYDCLVLLLDDPDIDQSRRNKIFAVIGYFIIPQDLYPESIHGPKGFIDDVLLALSILKDTADNYGNELVLNYWSTDESDFLYLIREAYPTLLVDFEELFSELMEYMGF